MIEDFLFKSLSSVRLFETPWTIQSMEFSRPGYWSELFPSPGYLPNPSLQGISRGSFPIQVSHIAGRFFTNWAMRENPRILERVAYPFSRDLPNPGIEPGSPVLQEDSSPAGLPGKPTYPLFNHSIQQRGRITKVLCF